MTASFLTAIILVVTTFVVISRNVHAKSRPRHWTPDSYPNPQKDTLGCGRNVTSWICDPDQVIPADVANAVDVLIARVASGAKPFGQAPCGKSGLEGFRVSWVFWQHSVLLTVRLHEFRAFTTIKHGT